MKALVERDKNQRVDEIKKVGERDRGGERESMSMRKYDY
jgi:hypothetical protein